MYEDVYKLCGRIHTAFQEGGLSLSVAESCTGGLICNSITDIPGASSFFKAGLVTYSIESKKTILGVQEATIRKWGVVSEETALEMAVCTRNLTNTDFSVATTGNLGPDALEGKNVGLVYIAVNSGGGSFSRKFSFEGNRAQNKIAATGSALKLLLEVIDLSG